MWITRILALQIMDTNGQKNAPRTIRMLPASGHWQGVSNNAVLGEFGRADNHPGRNISRVSNQNGVSLLYIMHEIHHSGREPSICYVMALETR